MSSNLLTRLGFLLVFASSPIEASAVSQCHETTSSFVHEVCYNEDTEQLRLKLRSRYYTYCAVPENVAAGLLSAKSKGSFFNSYIKGRYSC